MSKNLGFPGALREACELFAVLTAGLTILEFVAFDSILLLPAANAPRAAAAVVIAAKNAALLLPCLVLVAGFRGRLRTGLRLARVWAGGVAFWVPSDVIVWTTTGNHLRFYLDHALEPEAWRFAGGAAGVASVLDGRGWQIAALVGSTLLVSLGQAMIRQHRRPLERHHAVWLCVVASLVASGPLAQRVLPQREAFLDLNDAMAIEWNGGFARRSSNLENLDEELTRLYAEKFEAVSAPSPVSEQADVVGSARPNIVIVLSDSLRSTMLTRERMPRLWRLSRSGVRFDRMYAPGNRTPSGLYGLLYGRSAISMASGEELRLPWRNALVEQGYSIHFLQASKMWRRIEIITREEDFEILLELEGRDWERDARVLDTARDLLASETPRFIVALLVSTHQHYGAPQDYDSFFPPNDSEAAERGEMPKGCDFEAFTVPGPNRQPRQCRPYAKYARSVRYVDDLIADFVESLDLDNTILLVTGDHGESFGEDGGRYHGGALSDVQTQVPAVLWGPGVPANRSVAFPTSLNDTMGTVFELLGVENPTSVVAGHSWLAARRRNAPFAAVARYTYTHEELALVLIGDERRYLLNLDPATQRVEFRGPVDASGKRVRRELDPDDAQVVDWFGSFLDRELGL